MRLLLLEHCNYSPLTVASVVSCIVCDHRLLGFVKVTASVCYCHDLKASDRSFDLGQVRQVLLLLLLMLLLLLLLADATAATASTTTIAAAFAAVTPAKPNKERQC